MSYDFTKMPEVDFSKYKSPITAKIEISDISNAMNDTVDKMTKEIIDGQERYVYQQIMKVSDIQIDYDELTRALAYDRGQYEAGYRAGVDAAEKLFIQRIDNLVKAFEREKQDYKDRIEKLGLAVSALTADDLKPSIRFFQD